MFIDEYARSGPTAEGLQTDGTGAGEKIEHPCVFNTFAQNRKNRLADEVGGWTRHRCGNFDSDASGFSCDDSHKGLTAEKINNRSFPAKAEEKLTDVPARFQIKHGALP